MELRGSVFSHTHYIQAIKNGSIVKTLNVIKSCRPKLVYRAISDIYECVDAKNRHLPPECQPNDKFRGSFCEFDKLKDESSCSSCEDENSETVSEISASSCNDGPNDNGDSGVKMSLDQLKGMESSKISTDTFQCEGGDRKDEDSDCDMITLNQLKGILRRKRKVSGYVDLTTNDDIDLEAPLISFKSKPSKKKKTVKSSTSTLSYTKAAISPKIEEIRNDEDLVNSNCYPSVPIHVKIEAIEQISLEYLSVPCLDNDSSIGLGMHTNPSEKNSELHEVSEEQCAFNEISYDLQEHVDLPDVTSITSENMNIDDQDWIIHPLPVLSQSDLKDQHIVHLPFHDIDQEIISDAEDNNIANCSSFQGYSISQPISWQEEGGDKVQQPEKNSELHKVSAEQCAVNYISYDFQEHVEICLPDITSSTSEKVNVDDQEWNIHHMSVSSQSDLKDQYIVHPPFHDIDQEMISIEENSNIADCSSFQGHSVSHSISLQEEVGHNVQQPDNSINKSFICLGPSDDNSVPILEDQTQQEEGNDNELQQTDIIIDDSRICLGPNDDSGLLVKRDLGHYFPDSCLGPSDDSGVSVLRDKTWQEEGNDNELQQTDPIIDNSFLCLGPNDDSGLFVMGDQSNYFPDPCLNPDNLTPLLSDGSPTTDVEQCLHPADYTTTNGFAGIQPCDGNELSTSNFALNCQEGPNAPENLFSNRKVISPTSQERLCKAMHEDEIYVDNEQYKHMDQLCTEKQAHEKHSAKLEESKGLGSAEEPNKSNEDTINDVPYNTTPVNCSKGPLPKGILKIKLKECSGSPPLDSNGRTSIQNCAQSAISFSQRQMQDIEALALKLTKELNCMKVIVQDSLLSESRSLNYTNEVRAALMNAAKAEKSARKWLGMMNKDCNRFCRIMELSENKMVVHSPNTNQKERKKITFADEAGGELCQVKVFTKEEENDSLSSVVT